MDLKLLHEVLKKWPIERVLLFIQQLYPERKIYSVSVSWMLDPKYILKARGTVGDVIIGWREINYDKV